VKRTVGDLALDNLSRSNLESQVNSVCQSMVLEICMACNLKVNDQFSDDGIG